MHVLALIRVLSVALAALAVAAPSAVAQPDPSCRGGEIANGPFSYTPSQLGTKTFVGGSGDPWTGSFRITAPGKPGDTVFPAQSGGPCQETALASIRVFDIEQVADANGVPLDPSVKIDVNSPLGQTIAAAFFINPTEYLFHVAEALEVGVTITNPMVSPTDYGDYLVTIKAQAIGAGIGTGSGATVLLSLRPDSAVDVVPPDVTILQPAGDEILGRLAIKVSATDPTPGSGVNSLAASIRSAGNTVSEIIPLTLDQMLPVAAGVTVTGTGEFVPVGGIGPAGTTEAQAFTATSRSGIGTYTLSAQATDVAGNTGTASKTFKVSYDVSFTKEAVTGNCTPPGNTATCTGQFHFVAHRSSVTSDGAFMYDQTVRVDLLNCANDGVVATHVFGTGSVQDVVKIDQGSDGPKYQTHFRRGDLGVTGPGTYKARVSFMDVDGNWMEHAVSECWEF